MNHLLVLLPEEFNCYTKLERKLDRISSSLMNFKITTNSSNELLKFYQEHNRDCIEVSYLPDWKVFVQAFILFLIPYTISRFFHWVRMSEKEWEE